MNRLCILFFLFTLAACGQSGQAHQARVYGAANVVAGDTAAWMNPPFNGDRRAWEHEMDARARLQDEYGRIR